MNRSGSFFLIVAITAAISFTWLNSSWVTYKDFIFDQKDRQIDYYLSDFSILNTYPDGNMRYILKGRHLIHQQSSSASKIISPTIEAQDIDDSLIVISADNAIQSKKNGPILLDGEVIVTKSSTQLIENFNLLTSDLSYNPLSKELSSDADLILTSPVSGELKGMGFSTKLDEQELRIHNNVQAVFIPAK